MTVSASGGPMSDERLAEIQARADEIIAKPYLPGTTNDRWFSVEEARDVLALLAELASCRAVLTQHEQALRAIVDLAQLDVGPYYPRAHAIARAALEAR